MSICRKYNLLFLVALIALVGRADAQSNLPSARPANLRSVEAWTQAQQKSHAGNTNIWIARGVLADRSAQRVEMVAEATGLGVGSIAEFVVVGETSPKDYEALSVALAKAGDVCHALEFLGVPRGRPVKPALFQFWPKGERVQARIWQLGRDAKSGRLLSACLRDQRPQAAAVGGLVYVGSCWSGAVCQADADAPGALISTYNEPSVVLDVPGRAPQGEVYGNLVVAPEGRFDSGTLLVIELTPQPLSNGVARVVDVALTARPRAGVSNGVAGVECVTRISGSAAPSVTNDVKGTLAQLALLAGNGRDLFVRVTLDDALTTGTAGDLARVLSMVEGQGGVRVEAPPAGQVYYKAFLPDERWRTRADRPSQPWELRVSRNKDGVWASTLVQILEDWSKEGQLTPDLTPTEFPLARPEDLPGKIRELIAVQVAAVKQKLAKDGKPVSEDNVEQMATLQRINTLFVFAPPDAPLGTYLPAVRQVHDALPQVHVFVEK